MDRLAETYAEKMCF